MKMLIGVTLYLLAAIWMVAEILDTEWVPEQINQISKIEAALEETR